MSAKITLGIIEGSENLVHINDVNKSLDNVFFCPGCRMILIPVKSDARKKDWHFRHYKESKCTGERDIALHNYAIQILLTHDTVTLPKIGTISYSNPRKEVTIFEKRSDVAVMYDDVEVHFEIFVTHDLDTSKIGMYKSNKVRCIKVDLSARNLLVASPEVIKDAVLTQIKNKLLIYWHDDNLQQPVQQHSAVKLEDVVLAVIGFFIIRYVVLRIRKFFFGK